MKNRARLVALPAGVLLLVGVASCASSRPVVNHRYARPVISLDAARGDANRKIAGNLTGESLPETGSPRASDPARRMVYNASVALRVSQLDSARARLLRLMRHESGAYVLQSSEQHLQLRVPAPRLSTMLGVLPTLGKVESQDLQGEDVTDAYTDYRIRLDNVQRARQRYLELLARAATVTETLAVEKELQRLNTENDQLQGQLNRLEHLTDFATLDVELRERARLGPLGYLGLGLYKAVSWLFVRPARHPS